VYGRRGTDRRVPFVSVTDTTPPALDTPLPWRVRRPRDTRGFLSPAARRVVTETGVDPATVTGTGTSGRVTRADVLAAATATRSERVALNRVQQRAGAALLASKRTAAHAYSVVLADYAAVEAVRSSERERWRAHEGFSLTYLPFVARAAIDALREFPSLNATVRDDATVLHRDVGLGVAVDLAHQGLVVPVVRSASSLRMRALARSIDDLATRARAKQLVPDDLAGGTFTITNPGAARTWMSFPIVNQPQVAILSTDGVAKRVWADTAGSGRGRLEIRPCGHLCLAFDERAVHPADAGAFLARVATLLASRDWVAEL
jgi:2-oxoglutarate dehydrogenase E2 component (dihydrolipoamide succinyltransferase)